MDDILVSYGLLLQEVDEWFSRSSERAGSAVSCCSGCSECCRGLFDITLLDACYLKCGFEKLDESSRKAVLSRAEDRLILLTSLWPEFAEPYLLNYRPEDEWEELMPDDDETPCPLVGADGRCLVYDHRPMTCRLHGLPLIDVSGEVMHDEWCTLNFDGEDPLGRDELRWEFNRVFREELGLFRRFTERLFGSPINELDTFIPTALLIDFAAFDWHGWMTEFMKKPA
ncbi:MAG TPA: YkgJ family cysteine cluster protein [Geobacteraceae bacterium]